MIFVKNIQNLYSTSNAPYGQKAIVLKYKIPENAIFMERSKSYLYNRYIFLRYGFVLLNIDIKKKKNELNSLTDRLGSLQIMQDFLLSKF